MEEKALDRAPVWSDLVTFDGKPWRGKVDILSAGYPCQPFSLAGKRQGEKDPRHLWPHVRRILGECEAPVLFCENVPGHVSLGLENVWKDLSNMGFQMQAGIFSAAEVGASHVRERLFLLAYTNFETIRNLAASILEGWETHNGQGGAPTRHSPCGQSLDPALHDGNEQTPGRFPPHVDDFDAWDARLAAQPGLQPAISRGDDGLANKLDRYRLTGNGVVPLAAAYAFGTLAALATSSGAAAA